MGGTPIHKFRKGKEPKKPEKTAEQLATETRQRSLLDDEIEEQEDLLKKLARGKLGRSSLLSGAPRNVAEASGGVNRGGAGGGGSLLSGGGSSSPSVTSRGVRIPSSVGSSK